MTGFRKPTARQILRGHLLDRHGAQVSLTWLDRYSLAEMRKWHREQHHRYAHGLDHFHEGPNTGPSARPPGWDTGEGVKLKERHAR